MERAQLLLQALHVAKDDVKAQVVENLVELMQADAMHLVPLIGTQLPYLLRDDLLQLDFILRATVMALSVPYDLWPFWQAVVTVVNMNRHPALTTEGTRLMAVMLPRVMHTLFTSALPDSGMSRFSEVLGMVHQVGLWTRSPNVLTSIKLNIIKLMQVLICCLSGDVGVDENDFSLSMIPRTHPLAHQVHSLEMEANKQVEELFNLLFHASGMIGTAAVAALSIVATRRTSRLEIVLAALTRLSHVLQQDTPDLRTLSELETKVLLKVTRLSIVSILKHVLMLNGGEQRIQDILTRMVDLRAFYATASSEVVREMRRSSKQVEHDEPSVTMKRRRIQEEVKPVVLEVGEIQALPPYVMTQAVVDVLNLVSNVDFDRQSQEMQMRFPDPSVIHGMQLLKRRIAWKEQDPRKDDIRFADLVGEMRRSIVPVEERPMVQEVDPMDVLVEVMPVDEEDEVEGEPEEQENKPTLVQLTDNETSAMLLSSFERVLEYETLARGKAKEDWIAIASKLITRCLHQEEAGEWEMVNHVRDKLIDFLVADIASRRDLAIQWLYEEWTLDREKYFYWLNKLLDRLYDHIDLKSRAFVDFILDVPEMDQSAVDITRRMCNDLPRLPIGMITLRGMILQRPKEQKAALDVLLELCLHADPLVRSAAVVSVKKLMQEELIVATAADEYAVQALRKVSTMKLAEPLPEGEERMVEEGVVEQIDIIRHVEFYFALTAREPELLDEYSLSGCVIVCRLFVVYIASDPSVQLIVRKHLTPLIRSISMGSAKLLSILQHFPTGAESLVLRILDILTDKTVPSTQLIQAVKHAFQDRKLDVRFLIPVLTGMDKRDVHRYLPHILELLDQTEVERKVVADALFRVLNLSPKSMVPLVPQHHAKLTTSELLVLLHECEPHIGIKKTTEAIQICLDRPDVFSTKVLAVCLQQLCDAPTLPTLFMRTLYISLRGHATLASFGLLILQKLVTKRIWNDKAAWQGFLLCIKLLQPKSIPILVQLPRPQLADALKQEPTLKPLVKQLVADRTSEPNMSTQ